MSMKRYKLWMILACIITLTGCKHERIYFPDNVDVSNVNIVRFDTAILGENSAEELYAKYPEFAPVWFDYYLYQTMEFMGQTDPLELDENNCLNIYKTDTILGFAEILDKMQKDFADISDIEEILKKAFGRLTWLYPDFTPPTLYFTPSCMQHNILWLNDTTMAIGIDFYLGSELEAYNRFVNQYQKLHMQKHLLPVDIIAATAYYEFENDMTNQRLLDHMIYEGKLTYFISALLKEYTEFDIIGYSEEQLEWCKKNEKDIWHMMIDKHDLFTTSPITIKDYMNEGPFTPTISQEAPSRLGVWIGWQIVKEYMFHNQDVSLQKLMQETDAQKILEESYYKP